MLYEDIKKKNINVYIYIYKILNIMIVLLIIFYNFLGLKIFDSNRFVKLIYFL